ncbi:hypothetical protein [Actinotignum urinale]|nr:hypothetical protein [Actinotignum urinale]
MQGAPQPLLNRTHQWSDYIVEGVPQPHLNMTHQWLDLTVD